MENYMALIEVSKLVWLWRLVVSLVLNKTVLYYKIRVNFVGEESRVRKSILMCSMTKLEWIYMGDILISKIYTNKNT